MLLLSLAFTAPALAGPPSHPFLSSLTGSATPAGDFDKACGTAVDSVGNVYVASAGNDAIDVFDPSHAYLGTIANANGPCGLAVDSDGDLYVSETDVLSTGVSRVVKYTPAVYPLPGSPSWSGPVTVDSSGDARGIAVDPVDDRLYVARGDGVAVYRNDGSAESASNEVQRVRVIGSTGGSYTLRFRGQTTAPLAFDASNAEVDAALEALSTIGAGNVAVTAGPAGDVASHIVTFEGALHETTVPQLVGDGSALTGGGFGLHITTLSQGFSGRIGEPSLTDATGVAAYTYGSGDRYVFAADAASDELKVFAGSADFRELELAYTIDGSAGGDLASDATPGGSLGFGPAGTYLGVDPASGHVLAYDDARAVVNEFEATGTFVTQIDRPELADAEPTAIAVFPQRDELVRVETRATGGSFKLSFEGDQTAALPYNATAAQVEAALEGLPSIGAGNVSVSGGYDPARPINGSYSVAFVRALGDRDLDGELLADGSGLTGAGGFPPTTVTKLVEGSGPGRVYVSAGAGPGARLVAFAPFAPASRPPLPALSRAQVGARAVAVDSEGNVYVAAGSFIRVFSPAGSPLTTVENGNGPEDIAVDAAGNLYVLQDNSGDSRDETVVVYKRSAGATPSFGTPETVVRVGDVSVSQTLSAIGVNPANDHLFAGDTGGNMAEFDSAADGSGVVNPAFGAELIGDQIRDIAVYGRTGEVYVAMRGTGNEIRVLDAGGTRVVRKIDGSGAPEGGLEGVRSIDVDQANGHVVTDQTSSRGVVQEFDGSGAFVAQIGGFTAGAGAGRVALDNSGGPARGNLYLAYLDRLSALGPLSYGEVPVAVTGNVSGLGGGAATLNGSVDPRGFATTDCRFEYTTTADFDANGFAAATSVACAESAVEIGSRTGPVAVHADVGGLDPGGSYRFRLVAANEFGTGEGDAVLFGPPAIAAKRATGVHYTEAVLNATLNPAGLSTSWRFEYGTQGPCASNPCSSTTERTLPAGASAVDLRVPLTGLAEGATYHFRLVAENAAGSVAGADGSFTTLERVAQSCANDHLRTGASAGLPDCRAYELVTPADTAGKPPVTVGGENLLNNWQVTPTGPNAGNSVVYYLIGTMPGIDGSGVTDGLRARRGAAGWTSALFGPRYADHGGIDFFNPIGVDPSHEYSSWDLGDVVTLGTPAGFEPLGRGALGTDPDVRVDALTSGASHVVFSSDDRLEQAAPPAGTRAVYDRSPGGPTQVVSLLEGDATPAAGQHGFYQGISEDGSAIAFKVDGTLYVRRANATTVKVADAPNTFAGLSDDGERIFYADTTDVDVHARHLLPAALHAFDVGSQTATQIAADSIFVNVSDDGSRVYFTSQQSLGDAPLPADLSDKLYVWDGSSVRFVSALAAEDLTRGFLHGPGSSSVSSATNIAAWTEAVAPNPGPNGGPGRRAAPSRTTGDGRVLVFQSLGDLTGQNPGGFPQVYRFDSGDGSLVCVSCPAGGEPAAAEANLQGTNIKFQPTISTTLVPNVTVDGRAVFFETGDALVPEDVNGKFDVYQWRAEGSGGCRRPGGCLALISTGRSSSHSFLYSMTPDGSDVFFVTAERLVAGDLAGAYSIYDARVGGGFPELGGEPCVEDGCQGAPSAPPSAPPLATVTFAGAGEGAPRGGKVRVRRKRLRGAALWLRVSVPGAGVIVARGNHVERSRKRVVAAGSYKLAVKLTRRARRALARGKRLRLTLRVRFTPRVGKVSRARVRLVAERPAKRGRRARGARASSGDRGGVR